MKVNVHKLLTLSVITVLFSTTQVQAGEYAAIKTMISKALETTINVLNNNRSNSKANDAATHIVPQIQDFKRIIDNLGSSASEARTKMKSMLNAYADLINPKRKPNYKTIKYNIDLINGAIAIKTDVKTKIVNAYKSVYSLESILNKLYDLTESKSSAANTNKTQATTELLKP